MVPLMIRSLPIQHGLLCNFDTPRLAARALQGWLTITWSIGTRCLFSESSTLFHVQHVKKKTVQTGPWHTQRYTNKYVNFMKCRGKNQVCCDMVLLGEMIVSHTCLWPQVCHSA